ncbi:MAG: hypothetical protein KC486_09785 [Myxococcales bacterium]|nr:hypothetical protein [Myxococcales bacterium]
MPMNPQRSISTGTRRCVAFAVVLALTCACRPDSYVMPQPDLDLDASDAEREEQYERNKVIRAGNGYTGIHYSTAANPVPFHVRTNYRDFYDRYDATQQLYDRAVLANGAALTFSVLAGGLIGVGLGDKLIEIGDPPGFLERGGEIAIWSLAGASLATTVITFIVSARALKRLPEQYNTDLRRELRLPPATARAAPPSRALSLTSAGFQLRW